jgi:hypothetical protein
MVGHRPTSEFHKKNLFIITHLIRLYHSDPVIRQIFWAWVHNVHVAEFLGIETPELLQANGAREEVVG